MGVFIAFGYGPGISHATAKRFATEGYSIALVGRNEARLADGVQQLTADGFTARAYQADASDAAQIRRAISQIRGDLGAVSAVLWTAFRNGDVANILDAEPEEIHQVFAVGITGLLACVQEVAEDLKSSANGAILVANGALGEPTTESDAFAKLLNVDGTALENAAKSKLVGILAERLKDSGIYVGEITIAGSIKNTPTATATAIDPSDIADTYWSLLQKRDTTRTRVVETATAPTT